MGCHVSLGECKPFFGRIRRAVLPFSSESLTCARANDAEHSWRGALGGGFQTTHLCENEATLSILPLQASTQKHVHSFTMPHGKSDEACRGEDNAMELDQKDLYRREGY